MGCVPSKQTKYIRIDKSLPIMSEEHENAVRKIMREKLDEQKIVPPKFFDLNQFLRQQI